MGKLEQTETKNILVVDDDNDVCLYFGALLSHSGFRVITESNSDQVLKKIQSDSYSEIDLIVLDLMMPDCDGYDLLKELQRSKYQNVPVFIVTARNLDDGMIEMLRGEPNVREFWRKPIDSKEFKEKVLLVLGR